MSNRKKLSMTVYNTQKDIIFFTPGKTGDLFHRSAGHYISAEYLVKTQESLIKKTKRQVIYIEDRRSLPRS